jgi:predicted GIY-YIG superfamily endonuclease
LENLYVKKHKRTIYLEENNIYLLTTKEHIQNRIYIVGRTKNLTGRLSTYNKTSEHQVVYYKSCKSLVHLEKTEDLILFRLNEYRCQANRERICLPLEKDISFFTDIYDEIVDFVNK